MNLSNKKVFITGIAGDLGKSIAKQFIKEGGFVYGIDIDEKLLQKLNQEISSDKLKTFVCDICKPEMIKEITEQIPKIDILINSAGVYTKGKIDDTPDQKINQVIQVNLTGTIQVNLTGTIFVTKYLIEKLIRKDTSNKSLIVSINSILGKNIDKPERSIYSASKLGLHGFMKNLELELKNTNIKISSIYPDGIQTNFFVNNQIETNTTKFIPVENIVDTVMYIIKNSHKQHISQITIQKDS